MFHTRSLSAGSTISQDMFNPLDVDAAVAHVQMESEDEAGMDATDISVEMEVGRGLNSLSLRQNGRHFADDICRCIFVNEKFYILIEISLKFVPKGPINNIPALVQIMAWRRLGDRPLSEPMLWLILSIGILGTNFSENWCEIHTFSFKKMHLRMSSAKWQQFCLGLNVFYTHCVPATPNGNIDTDQLWFK